MCIRDSEEAEQIFHSFHEMVTGKTDPEDTQDLGALFVLSGVSEFPSRVKCATLSWHTLISAMRDENKEVNTEKVD